MVPAMCYDKLQAQVVAGEQFQTSPAKEKKSKFVWLNGLTFQNKHFGNKTLVQTALIELLQSAMAEDKRVPWRSSMGQLLMVRIHENREGHWGLRISKSFKNSEFRRG